MEQIDKTPGTECETLNNNEGPKFIYSTPSFKVGQFEFRLCLSANFSARADEPQV